MEYRNESSPWNKPINPCDAFTLHGTFSGRCPATEGIIDNPNEASIVLHGQGPDRDPEAPFMLIRRQPQGLYCEVGDFFIDPSKGVDRAVITHAHADHARRGSRRYLCASPCEALLKIRLGKTKNH